MRMTAACCGILINVDLVVPVYVLDSVLVQLSFYIQFTTLHTQHFTHTLMDLRPAA